MRWSKVFLRAGNENFREGLRNDFHLKKALKYLEYYLKRDENGNFEVNGEAPFIIRPDPPPPPLDEEDLIEL